MIKLDLQSRLPIYEQLKNKIGELVLVGELHPGDQLPSVRSFARDLGVNPNTVQKAYQELEREGVVYSVAGRGSYVSPSSELTGLLQAQHLRRVRLEAARASAGGIPLSLVLDAVKEAYAIEGESEKA